MSAADIGFAVSALTDGAFVDEFLLNDDKIDMYLYSDAGTSATLELLDRLPIHTPSGVVVPLSAVADIVERVDTNSIRRVDGRRMVTLSIIPPDDIPLETAVQIVRQEVVAELRDRGEVPASVAMEISGASDQLDATREALSGNYVIAVVIIYLLLVAIFTHWGYPLLIMTTIPLGVAGGIVGLWLMNWVGGLLPLLGGQGFTQPFDMIAMLGFLILMGTVVNNPILIVHQAMTNIREAGMDVVDAVRNAVETRLRPIAMSTLTTVFGLAPLVLLPGAGTELYRGVGAIVMFGVMGTAIVALTFLPALTIMVLTWSRPSAASSPAGSTAAPADDPLGPRAIPVRKTGTD
jgi:multidrug efflux pump subunit AcrB